MGILNQQLFIGDKIIANDITTNRSARSVTKRNGFYLNHMYQILKYFVSLLHEEQLDVKG